jgi:hypothetical protein
MKIIFLDVDGVLNRLDNASFGYRPDAGYDLSGDWPPGPLDVDKIDLLNKFIKDTGAKVVLISSWRHVKKLYDKISKYIDIFDVTGTDKIYDVPGELFFYEFREGQIVKWLTEHKNIENYVIFDDNYILGTDKLRKHFVQTNLYEGLQKEDIKKAKKILKTKTKE